MKKGLLIYIGLFALAFILDTNISKAAGPPGPPPPPPGGPPCFPPPCNAIPIDGGISILAAAALAFGAKKAYDSRKNKS